MLALSRALRALAASVLSAPAVAGTIFGLVTAAGSMRGYQCWYRDAASFCAPASFNTTNLVGVRWEL